MVNKTKVMEVSRTGGGCEVRVQDKQVEQVKAMKYLGVMMSDDGSMDEEVEHRIGTATRMIGAMSTKVLQKSELRRKTKMKVYNACIVPALLYGCESWTLQARHMSRLQAVEMKYLRRVAGVTWMDRVRNEEVHERKARAGSSYRHDIYGGGRVDGWRS